MDLNIPSQLIDLAKDVLDAHRRAGTHLAVAESCTGGLVAAALTEIAGSSDVLLEGFVTYSNAAKERALGVPTRLLERFGAVSPEVARAMAEGARRASGADLTVAITGVAGPGGGSVEKPVGHVCFARADPARCEAVTVRFESTDRAEIRHAAAKFALALLLPAAQMPAGDAIIALPAP